MTAVPALHLDVPCNVLLPKLEAKKKQQLLFWSMWVLRHCQVKAAGNVERPGERYLQGQDAGAACPNCDSQLLHKC